MGPSDHQRLSDTNPTQRTRPTLNTRQISNEKGATTMLSSSSLLSNLHHHLSSKSLKRDADHLDTELGPSDLATPDIDANDICLCQPDQKIRRPRNGTSTTSLPCPLLTSCLCD